MSIKIYGLKCYFTLIIGFLLILFLIPGCTSFVPTTDEGLVTQVINQYFKAINNVNRENALSYTIPNEAAYEATNMFFDNKVPLAEQKDTQYVYTYEIKSLTINSDSAKVNLKYSFRLIGFDEMSSPTLNGEFALKKINEIWLLDTAPLAS